MHTEHFSPPLNRSWFFPHRIDGSPAISTSVMPSRTPAKNGLSRFSSHCDSEESGSPKLLKYDYCSISRAGLDSSDDESS